MIIKYIFLIMFATVLISTFFFMMLSRAIVAELGRLVAGKSKLER